MITIAPLDTIAYHHLKSVELQSIHSFHLPAIKGETHLKGIWRLQEQEGLTLLVSFSLTALTHLTLTLFYPLNSVHHMTFKAD